jgi:PiT family inorganic phosphate transporter
MILGALGLAVGLILFGPKVIRTIGSELTGLDAMRAWCVAMAATMTVIVASQLGLPVSTTHVTVGAVLGVGFVREWLKAGHQRALDQIRTLHADADPAALEAFLARFYATPFGQRKAMLADLKARNRANTPAALSPDERKALTRAHKRDLVNREMMLKIFAAWIITVPATAAMAALIFFTLRGMML